MIFKKKIRTEIKNAEICSEDYISGEAIGSPAWKIPLSRKHLTAISATVVTALALSFAVSQNVFNFNKEDRQAVSGADNSFSYVPVDTSKPLAQNRDTQMSEEKNEVGNIVADTSSKKVMENYDDDLPDADLSDSDQALDKEIRKLAVQVDKDPVVQTDAKWLTENVQKGDTISSLFKDLNIPANLVMSILDHKEVASSVNGLKLGEQLSFLVNDDGELLAFIKPLNQKEQLRFYRTNLDNSNFNYVKEPLNAHTQDDNGVPELLANLEKAAKPENNEAANKIAAANDKAKSSSSANIVKSTEPAKADKTVQAEKKITAATRGRLVLVKVNKGETFSSAAVRSGITYSEINRILSMFKGRIQFSRNIRANDTMRVLFTESKGKGKICAVEFNLHKGGKVASYLNPADGKYYDERGLNSSKSSFMRFPFRAAVKVTSPFNPSRRHPITGKVRPHNGVDFGLPIGTSVTAPAAGIVDKATFSRTAGYYIVIRHSGGWSTVYMHLSKLGVRQGQRVRQGAVIARTGNTGISTGPHLHYEIRVQGRAVNPLRINLGARDYEVNAKNRKAFASNISRYKKDLYNKSLIAKN